MEVTININDYLSEEDKVSIAKEAFKEQIEKEVLAELKKEDSSRKMQDYERIVGNSIHYFLQDKIDSILNKDHIAFIEEKVRHTILKNKDYNYDLFRKKTVWETEDSPAQLVVTQAIQEQRDHIKNSVISKINENIEALDTETTLEVVREIFYEIIENKLKGTQQQ